VPTKFSGRAIIGNYSTPQKCGDGGEGVVVDASGPPKKNKSKSSSGKCDKTFFCGGVSASKVAVGWAERPPGGARARVGDCTMEDLDACLYQTEVS